MKFNIVLKSLKTSLAIVLVVILASCAKQLPKPSKEVKSVLVIPAEVVNKTQMERKYDYVFNFQSKPNSGSWYGNNSPQNDQLFSVRGNLQKNGKFTYKIFDDIKITGSWSITGYPYILLENEEPYLHYYFEIKRSKKVDKISEIEVIDLQPVSSSLIISNCKLTYGERV